MSRILSKLNPFPLRLSEVAATARRHRVCAPHVEHLECRALLSTVPVNINQYVNHSLQGYTNGSDYPPGGTQLTVAGVPFTLADYPGGGAGDIQTPESKVSAFDVPVSIDNPGTVYTLINSTYGVFGDTIGSVEFKATGGLDYTVHLVEGQDIRDHNRDGFNNTIGQGALGGLYVGTASFAGGQVRLDEQAFALPASFHSATLTDIILHGNGNYPDGNPFLAAASVSASTIISLSSFAPDSASNPLLSNGNYDGTYQISGAALPNNPNLTLGVYWATGPAASDVIGSPVYTAPMAAQAAGTYKFSVNLSNLVFPPSNAQYLVAILDNQKVLPAAQESNNVAAIGSDVLQAPLSYELDSIAPSIDFATTREQRVFLWLAQYSSTINATASDYGIDPRAIAGAIAWEALQNTHSLGNKLAVVGIDALGPGKIVPYGDASTVEGTNKFGHFLPSFGIDFISRDYYLEDPVHAIRYAAAILNAYAVEASAVGINLRTVDNIGILVSYYEGVKLADGSYVTLQRGQKYFSQRALTLKSMPLMHNTEMGQWVDNNLDYLGMALGTN